MVHGCGNRTFWVCFNCAQNFPNLPSNLLDAVPDIIQRPDSFEFIGGCCGFLGSPEVKHRQSNLYFSHRNHMSPLPEGEKVIDIQADALGRWVCLTSTAVFVLDFEAGQCEKLVQLQAHFPIDAGVSLRVSKKLDFLAIFQTKGQHGLVIDLMASAAPVVLDRGSAHFEASHFPIAFFEASEQTRLVVATHWWRLDILDPASGRVLTPRVLDSSSLSPRHRYFFHGQLHVSSDNEWIVDDGWVSHPQGQLKSWSLTEWLHVNPCESENGTSRRHLSFREHMWDLPLCWIDAQTIAVWGWGGEPDSVNPVNRHLIPAVRFYDVATGIEQRWFAGPEACCWRESSAKKHLPSLFFDRYLFSIGNAGTMVWNIETGEQILHDEAFMPIQFNPVAHEFLTWTGECFKLSKLAE